MNKEQRKIVGVYEKGYRVVNGEVISPFSGKPRTLTENKTGYYSFSVRFENTYASVRVHNLVAYQKYGVDAFKENMQVRHLDNNKKNNLDNNIVLGTPSQNRMDMAKQDRVRVAKIAARKRRKGGLKYSDKLAKTIKKEKAGGARNCDLCRKYNIPEASLRRLLNRNIGK